MKHFSKLLFVLIFALGISKAHAQVTTSFFTNASDSKIGLGYNFNDRFWSDFRVYSNNFLKDFTPELLLNYNFLLRDRFEAYVGLGAIVIDEIQPALPVGVALRPFPSVKELSINMEVMVTPIWNELFLMGFIGLRYVY